MTKKGLLKRSGEFKEYEEQTFSIAKQRLEKYASNLDSLELAIDIDLIWYYFGKDEDFSYSRLDLKQSYICAVDIQIRRKADPKHDMDLEAITYIHPIAIIKQNLFWFGSIYSKVPKKMYQEFLDAAEECVLKVLEQGYEPVFEDIKKQDKFSSENNSNKK